MPPKRSFEINFGLTAEQLAALKVDDVVYHTYFKRDRVRPTTLTYYFGAMDKEDVLLRMVKGFDGAHAVFKRTSPSLSLHVPKGSKLER